MQSLKIVMRAVGTPTTDGSVVSGSDAEEYIQYQYLSKGYTIQSTQYLGPVKSKEGTDEGYRLLFVLVKDEASHASVAAEDKKKKE